MTGRTLDGVSPSDTKLLLDFLNRLGSFENANRSQAKNLSRFISTRSISACGDSRALATPPLSPEANAKDTCTPGQRASLDRTRFAHAPQVSSSPPPFFSRPQQPAVRPQPTRTDETTAVLDTRSSSPSPRRVTPPPPASDRPGCLTPTGCVRGRRRGPLPLTLHCDERKEDREEALLSKPSWARGHTRPRAVTDPYVRHSLDSMRDNPPPSNRSDEVLAPLDDPHLSPLVQKSRSLRGRPIARGHREGLISASGGSSRSVPSPFGDVGYGSGRRSSVGAGKGRDGVNSNSDDAVARFHRLHRTGRVISSLNCLDIGEAYKGAIDELKANRNASQPMTAVVNPRATNTPCASNYQRDRPRSASVDAYTSSSHANSSGVHLSGSSDSLVSPSASSHVSRRGSRERDEGGSLGGKQGGYFAFKSLVGSVFSLAKRGGPQGGGPRSRASPRNVPIPEDEELPPPTAVMPATPSRQDRVSQWQRACNRRSEQSMLPSPMENPPTGKMVAPSVRSSGSIDYWPAEVIQLLAGASGTPMGGPFSPACIYRLTGKTPRSSSSSPPPAYIDGIGSGGPPVFHTPVLLPPPQERGLQLACGIHCIPKPDKTGTGGADGYFIDEQCCAVGVADGVGEWEQLGINPRMFADEVMEGCRAAAPKINDIDSLSSPSMKARRILQKGFDAARAWGSSTALVACLDEQGKRLGVANLGDSSALVLRRGGSDLYMTVVRRIKEQQHNWNCPFQLANVPVREDWPILEQNGLHRLLRLLQNAAVSGASATRADQPAQSELYDVPVKEGDLLIFGTDGVFDNLHDYEVCALCSLATSPWEARLFYHNEALSTHPDNIARALAKAAFFRSLDSRARTPFARGAARAGEAFQGGKPDDITVLAAWVTFPASSPTAQPRRSLPRSSAQHHTSPQHNRERKR
ncbi:unnamed protein product [Vitrella brassicaformis CCMP3155]|uniref:PPM-type phosphatase domain-containing protein n=3 Tax=Vitrella brassicaformis TaxID=1169539 RepID=A0A0G4GAC7_VITBC|nr:unnamed protein product [Vitrella brassicaformis CCMP3155]|eukprot:CEM25904.1 unnamed protein product [Vitrella brassicaformis CCMP3155]